MYILCLQKDTQNIYKEADAALKKNPDIKRIVGRQLGGSAALELANNYKHDDGEYLHKTTTDGAPVVSNTGGDIHIYYGDPVSVFDRGAKSELTLCLNPHNCTGFNADKKYQSHNIIFCIKRRLVPIVIHFKIP